MPFRRYNISDTEPLGRVRKKEELSDLGQEFDLFSPDAQQLYQEDPEEFNRIFKERKKRPKTTLESPWKEEWSKNSA